MNATQWLRNHIGQLAFREVLHLSVVTDWSQLFRNLLSMKPFPTNYSTWSPINALQIDYPIYMSPIEKLISKFIKQF